MSFIHKVEGMSRGLLVLDENVNFAQEELKNKNIRVTTPLAGMTDEQIAEKMASHRILVTNNTKDFMQFAIEYEIGLIATENLPKDAKLFASLISKAITTLGLWSKHKPFLVTFKEGKPIFQQLGE
jgi:hypothetical protein